MTLAICLSRHTEQLGDASSFEMAVSPGVEDKIGLITDLLKKAFVEYGLLAPLSLKVSFSDLTSSGPICRILVEGAKTQ
jgi:hypothetical protein